MWADCVAAARLHRRDVHSRGPGSEGVPHLPGPDSRPAGTRLTILMLMLCFRYSDTGVQSGLMPDCPTASWVPGICALVVQVNAAGTRTCRGAQGAELRPACAASCRDACRDGLAVYTTESSALSGFKVHKSPHVYFDPCKTAACRRQRQRADGSLLQQRNLV